MCKFIEGFVCGRENVDVIEGYREDRNGQLGIRMFGEE